MKRRMVVALMVIAVGGCGEGDISSDQSRSRSDPPAAQPSMGGVNGSPGAPPTTNAPQQSAQAALYAEDRLVELELRFTDQQWADFLSYRQANQKVYVHCELRYGGATFTDAACRSKGNPEVWPDELKPGFIVKFNEWNPAGRFLGLRKLNLEADPYHDAPIRDRLGMWLMREAGVPAPRVNHAKVILNGESLGLYQNIEAIDREFLESRFVEPDGNLYTEGVLKTNETLNDTSRLELLESLVKGEASALEPEARYAALANLVDIDEIVREMAAEALLPTVDNFINGSDNFYYYDDLRRGFVVIPWDLDTLFDEYTPPDVDPLSPWGAVIGNPGSQLRALIDSNPLWHDHFVRVLVELRDGPYARLASQAEALCAQVRPAVEEDLYRPAADMEDFDADCLRIREQIAQRSVFLRAIAGD